MGINFFRNYIFGIADVRDLLVCYLMAELAERESQNDRRLSRAAQLSGEGELQIQVVSTLTFAASSCLVLLFLFWLCERNACPICLWSFLFTTKGPTVVVLIDSWLIWSHPWRHSTGCVCEGISRRVWLGGKDLYRTSPDRKRPYPACLSSLLPKQSLIANTIFIWQQESRVGTAEASSFVDWVLCSPRM